MILKRIGICALLGTALLALSCENSGSHQETKDVATAESAARQPDKELAAPPGGGPAPIVTESAAPPASVPAPEERKPPSFWDAKTGEIKDLPKCPRSQVYQLRYGPVSGSETMMIMLQSKLSFDEAVGFYEKAVKQNGWSVDSYSRDPGSHSWRLSKGMSDGAGIDVKQDKLTGRTVV